MDKQHETKPQTKRCFRAWLYTIAKRASIPGTPRVPAPESPVPVTCTPPTTGATLPSERPEFATAAPKAPTAHPQSFPAGDSAADLPANEPKPETIIDVAEAALTEYHSEKRTDEHRKIIRWRFWPPTDQIDDVLRVELDQVLATPPNRQLRPSIALSEYLIATLISARGPSRRGRHTGKRFRSAPTGFAQVSAQTGVSVTTCHRVCLPFQEDVAKRF